MIWDGKELISDEICAHGDLNWPQTTLLLLVFIFALTLECIWFTPGFTWKQLGIVPSWFNTTDKQTSCEVWTPSLDLVKGEPWLWLWLSCERMFSNALHLVCVWLVLLLRTTPNSLLFWREEKWKKASNHIVLEKTTTCFSAKGWEHCTCFVKGRLFITPKQWRVNDKNTNKHFCSPASRVTRCKREVALR